MDDLAAGNGIIGAGPKIFFFFFYQAVKILIKLIVNYYLSLLSMFSFVTARL